MALGSTLLGDAYVDIMGETSKLERSLAQAQGMVSSFVSNAGKAIFVGIGAALAGVAGVGIASVWAWAMKEQSVKDLESSIRMLGGSVDELVPKYEKVMNQIKRNTTIDDTATRKAMAYAAALGAPVDRLDDLAIAAAGLSGRLKMGLEGAMMILVRSMKSGRFDMFSRYGLQLDKTMTAQEKMNEVMKFAAAGFQKQAAMADTLSGRLGQLCSTFGDLMKGLGKKIAEKFQLKEIVDEISKRMYRIVRVFDTVLQQIKPGEFSLEKIGQGFENIAIKIISIIELLPRIAKMIGDMWKSGDMMTTIGTAFKASAKLFINVLMEGFKGLQGIFQGLGKAIGSAIISSLLEVPILGKKIAAPFIERQSKEQADYMDLMLNKPGATNVERLTQLNKARFEAGDEVYIQSIKEQIAKESKQGIISGVEQAQDAFIKSQQVIKEYWEAYKKEVADAVSKIKPEEDLGSILESIIEKWKARFAAAPMTEDMPGIGNKGGWEIGGAGESFQKTGFAAWWYKVQEATKMTEAEKVQIKAQQGIEKNTRELVNYFKGEKGQPQTYLWAAMA